MLTDNEIEEEIKKLKSSPDVSYSGYKALEFIEEIIRLRKQIKILINGIVFYVDSENPKAAKKALTHYGELIK